MPRTIQDPRLPPPSGPYCYAFRAGSYIFLGGMPGITTEALVVDGVPNGRMAGETPGRADMEAQTRQAIESLKLAVEIAGGKWRDVLRLNLFLDGWREVGPFLKAYEKHLAPAEPADTLTGYGLYMPSMIMEIEGLAGAGETTPLLSAGKQAHEYAPSYAGRRIGDLLCLSARLPLDADGQVVSPGNARAQTEAIVEGIGDILTENGGSLDDVIRLRVFVRDMRDVEAVEAGIDDAFAEPGPVTTIVTAPLPILGADVKIEATAYLGEKEYRTGPGNARGVLAGEMMISNGILSVDDEGGVRDPGDIQKQTRNVLANVELLLKEFDMEVLDVAQSQVSLTDFRDYDAYNALYRNFFTFPFPARNSVETGLGKISHYGLKYQIEVTAIRNASTEGLVVTAEDSYYFRRIELEGKA